MNRRAALLTLAGATILLVALGAVLVPWGWGPAEPVAPSELFSQAQIDRAETYSWSVRLLSWAAYAVSLAVAAVLGFTSLGSRLMGALPRTVRLPLGVLALLVVGRLATLPFALVIRRQNLRYDLTRQSFAGWLRDDLTSLLVAWVATTIGLGLMVWLARRTPRWWFAWASAGAAGLTFVLSFAYPLVVEPLFNRFASMQAGELKQSILRLADEEGVPVDDVLVADASRRTTTLNAYVSGIGQTKRVVVYDNLVNDLPAEQVLVVVAHELAHTKHEDVLVGTALGAVGSIVGVCLLALILDLPGVRRRARVDGPGDPRVAALVLALAAFGTLAASPVQNTASRAIEARADLVSLEATRDLAGFTAMQRQLSLKSLSDPTPPRLSHFWFGSHPTTLERIGLAREVLR